MSQHVYLFRYRDLLTTDTLGEHRELIDEHGSCWWGWWQRPGEQPRQDAWDTLARHLQTTGSVRIGLFNSDPQKDTEQIHWATLTKVIPPQVGGSAPKLPDAETRLVPEYYRETPFSSAWMRLSEIDKSAENEFFGRYAFAEAPRLRGISKLQSDRFVDKIVLDADELRTMDTTIWKVRPQQDGDRQERILTAAAGLTGALSHQPVLLGGCRILHISDLHFAIKMRNEHRWAIINEHQTTLHERILSAVGEASGIGLVVLSGDITHIAAREEFYEAFRFIHGLLGALQLGPEHLVMVPGNHDIGWSRHEDDVWTYDAPVEQADELAMAPFRLFYERVFRHPASPCLGMARRFVLPNGLTLEIGGLNSSGLKYGQNYLAGMGRLPDGAFDEIRTTLGWSEEPSAALRLLVHHHHLSATEDVLPAGEFTRGFGMSVDAKQTLRKAARHGVQLVLHGHRHQPYLGAEQVYAELERTQPKYSLGRVGIVGGGSAGSTSVTNDTNFFNVLDLRTSGISLSVYAARSTEGRRDSFARMNTFVAPLRSEGGRLILGEWESAPPSDRSPQLS